MLKNTAASKEEMTPSVETDVTPVQDLAVLLAPLLQGKASLATGPVDALVEDVIEALATTQNSAITSEIKRLVGTGSDEAAMRNRVKDMVLQYQQQTAQQMAPKVQAEEFTVLIDEAPKADAEDTITVIETMSNDMPVVEMAMDTVQGVVQDVAPHAVAPAVASPVIVSPVAQDVAQEFAEAVVVVAPAPVSVEAPVVVQKAVAFDAQDVVVAVTNAPVVQEKNSAVPPVLETVEAPIVAAPVAQDMVMTKETTPVVQDVNVAPVVYDVVQKADINKQDIDQGIYAEPVPVMQVAPVVVDAVAVDIVAVEAVAVTPVQTDAPDIVADVTIAVAPPVAAPVSVDVAQDLPVMATGVVAAPVVAVVQEIIAAPAVAEIVASEIMAVATTHVEMTETTTEVTGSFMDVSEPLVEVVAANDDVAIDIDVVEAPVAQTKTIAFVPAPAEADVVAATPDVQEKAVTALFTMQIVEQGMEVAVAAANPVTHDAFEDTKKDATTKADVLVEQDIGYDWWAELTGQMGGYQQPMVPYAKPAYKNVA